MRAVLTQLALAVLAIVAGLAFAPAFGGRLTAGDVAPGALVVAVSTGALVPAVVAVLARRAGLDATLAAVLGLVLTAIAVVLVTRPGTAVASGPYRLLTSALPAPADGPACATIASLTGLAALVAALIADYARLRVLAVVPALVALIAAVALDAGAAEPPAWYAALVLVVIGVALALIREPVRSVQQPASSGVARVVRSGFPLVGAAAILAVGGLLGAALAADLPAVRHHAADPRSLVAPPLRPRSAVNPMQQYPALAQGVDTLRLRGVSSRRLRQLTLVTLDGFNGRTWTTRAQFRRAGTILGLAHESPRVSVDITAADAHALSWLVRPDRPVSIDRSGLGTDQSTGDLVVPRGAAYPHRYRVVGTTPTLPTDALDSDQAVRRTGPVSTGSSVPAMISEFAGRTKAETDDYHKVLALSVLLRGQDFYVDNTRNAPGGSGYYQLLRLLQAPVKHVGTSEQYASAFAVMARVLGFRSRVVLGFVPHYTSNSATSGNSFTITGRDVHVWPQVQFARAGWVTFDPTPTQVSSQPRTRRNPAGSNASPTRAPRNPASVATPKPANSAPRGSRGAASTADNTLLSVLLPIAVVIALLLAGPPGIKARRRHRRRGSSRPAHAVYGAWRETTDRLAEFGLPPPRGKLTSEVAAGSPAPVRDHVRALGALLDRAGYAPEDAPSHDAQIAWHHADSTVRTLRAGMSPWRRLIAALDPRPLWRR